MNATIKGPDGRARCGWCVATAQLQTYHDTEWGFPSRDERYLFETLCLEGFQSGLSWRTILAKRDNFRAAFHEFDIDRVARFSARDVVRLLRNEGIVRHRGKIEAVIHNARRVRELTTREGPFAAYLWRYQPAGRTRGQRVATSPAALALSKDLRKHGLAFVGPTTVHAFMQAVGLINDHALGCVIRNPARRARGKFKLTG